MQNVAPLLLFKNFVDMLLLCCLLGCAWRFARSVASRDNSHIRGCFFLVQKTCLLESVSLDGCYPCAMRLYTAFSRLTLEVEGLPLCARSTIDYSIEPLQQVPLIQNFKMGDQAGVQWLHACYCIGWPKCQLNLPFVCLPGALTWTHVRNKMYIITANPSSATTALFHKTAWLGSNTDVASFVFAF